MKSAQVRPIVSNTFATFVKDRGSAAWRRQWEENALMYYFVV